MPTEEPLALIQLSANRMDHWKDTMDLVCSRAAQRGGMPLLGTMPGRIVAADMGHWSLCALVLLTPSRLVTL